MQAITNLIHERGWIYIFFVFNCLLNSSTTPISWYHNNKLVTNAIDEYGCVLIFNLNSSTTLINWYHTYVTLVTTY